MVLESRGQQTAEFHLKPYMFWNGANYVDEGGNILYRLTRTPTPVTNIVYTGVVGVSVPDSQPITLSETVVNDVLGFAAVPQYLGLTRVYGDIRQSHDTLYLYPWPVMGAAITPAQTAANLVFTTNTFFMIVPPRTITTVRYNSWHYGALTLPAKVYLWSKKQLNDNVVFDVNIAGMIGKKWGRSVYYNLPHIDGPQTHVKGTSWNLLGGITKIETDSTNTTNEIETAHTLLGFNIGTAVGYHYDKVGGFMVTGFDLPIGNNSQQWVFNGSLWFGIGFNLD